MILFVKLTKGIGHKFYQLMKSSPINTINSHSPFSFVCMSHLSIMNVCIVNDASCGPYD